jgi:mRNA interferase RelE/StbE
VAKYEMAFKPSVLNDVGNIPARDPRRINEAILALADDPRPNGCVKLTGEEFNRTRTGEYRVVYEILDRVLLVTVIKVAQRGNAYK